jgi:uncharacterized membrane protein
MKLSFRPAALAGILFVVAAGAHETPVARYRVQELPRPASFNAGCLPGYAISGTIGKINDFGVANAAIRCVTAVDLTAGTFTSKGGIFVVAPWFGAVMLPQGSLGADFAYGINNRGELFGGSAEPDGVHATKWTLGGGRETVFANPACDGVFPFANAVEGNGSYVVGWALRPAPEISDPLCFSLRWVIRTPAGTEVLGPLNGIPADINASNVAVGSSNRSAIRYNVVTGQVRVLHAATPNHNVEIGDINDLGEVAGRITVDNNPAQIFCEPGVAVRWERDGRERVLPHLPGAVSSRALAVGYDGEVFGDSGAGEYCPETDHGRERAVLWKNGRVYDLNTLIPRSAGITLTYASSTNRMGQVTAAGTVNSEPMAVCAVQEYDPETAAPSVRLAPCRNIHIFVLTPTKR